MIKMEYNVIITAGGTSERIDNVRKITNSGSGKLGFMIANKLIQNGSINKIYYICSKESYKPTNPKVEVIEITDTKELQDVVKSLLSNNTIHYFIHSMAVSDYTIDYVTTVKELAQEIENKANLSITDAIINFSNGIKDGKISSYEKHLIIKLKPTPKIISIIKDLSPHTFLVGFKLLNHVSKDELLETAIKLKDKNHCDMVIANDLSSIRNGDHEAFIIRNDNSYIHAHGKEDIAKKLIKEMFQNA